MGLLKRKLELEQRFNDLEVEIMVNNDMIRDCTGDGDISGLHECHEQIEELTQERRDIVIELSQILRSQEYTDELYRAN